MSADWAADIADRAMYGDPLDSSDEEGVSRARASRPPFVRSVRSVSFPADTHTSKPDTHTPPGNVKALTRENNTSHDSHTPPVDLLAGVRTGKYLNEAVFPPLQFAIPGILPRGFAIMAGPPKAGKSWVALDWLLSIAAGGRALGKIAVGVPRRVLYFALEDSDERMQTRCFALMQGAGVPELFHYETRVQPHLLVPTVEAFLEAFPDTALVVVDTLGKVMPPMLSGETTYQRDYRIGSKLHQIAHTYPGLCVLAVHHTRKSVSADFVDSVSGTNGLAGAADTVLVLSRDRNSSEGKLQVTSRDVEEAEYALTSEAGRWSLEGADLEEAAERAYEREETDHLGDKSKAILDYVAEYPGGVTPKEAVAKFGKSVHEYLRRLLEGGHIERPSRGRYVISKGKD